jgi:hypothetical protein
MQLRELKEISQLISLVNYRGFLEAEELVRLRFLFLKRQLPKGLQWIAENEDSIKKE